MKINDSFPFFYKNLIYDNVVHLILFLPFSMIFKIKQSYKNKQFYIHNIIHV